MRILAYTQLLESYRSLTVDSLSRAFGVSVEFVDRCLRFSLFAPSLTPHPHLLQRTIPLHRHWPALRVDQQGARHRGDYASVHEACTVPEVEQ
ncbi:hypothetical protein C0993_012788, partial [Termitomyces sp. T159_Od127]